MRHCAVQRGRWRVSLRRTWDRPYKERAILPTLLYRSTLHWWPRALGHAEMGRALEVGWWCWALSIEYIVHPLHQTPEKSEATQ